MPQARRALVTLISVVAVVLGLAPPAFAASPPAPATARASAMHAARASAMHAATPRLERGSTHTASSSPGAGYWLATQGGDIFEGGAAEDHGAATGVALSRPIVGIAAIPSRHGYWLVASDGGIFAFGDAAFHGSTGAIALNKPIVGMASTPSGHGYWLVASDGGIFAFGDARFFGSTGAIALNKPIVGITSTPSGHGYWMVASDGGIFAFGDAAFHGSTGAIALHMPIVGITSTPSGHGYWMVASDGGIFAFGDARFFGSTGAIALNQPIVGMAASASGHGYWFVAADGGVFSFGDARFLGSGNDSAHAPVVGIAPSAPITPALPPSPAATMLAFTNQPSTGATGGAAFAVQPEVTVETASGATATSDTSPIELAVTNIGQQTVACNVNPKAAVAGVATFAGCNIDASGTYTLTATDGTLTSARSTSIVIRVGPAAILAFVRQPSGATSLDPFGTQPRVAVEDLGHNTVSTASPGNVVLIITQPSNPVGSVLACTATTVPTVNGLASFAGCNIDRSGTFTLHAADAGMSATSSPLSITAGAATHLAFSTQPVGSTGGDDFATPPVVTVRDLSNNTVTTDASSVVLSITQPSNPVSAALTCTPSTTKAVVAGVAAFAGCRIDLASTTSYTLHATDAALPAINSNTFAVGVGAATELGFTTQPSASTGGTAFTTQPVVVVRDAGGNTVTTGTHSVTLTITQPSNPVGATLTCPTNPVASVNGIASFGGCAIDKVSGTTYTLTAAVTGGPAGATSAAFAITVGAATKLGFTTQPTASTGGTVFPNQPAVAAEDAGGNTVTANASPITLTITQPSNPVGAALTCSTNPVTPTAGVATFAGCRIDLKSTTTYALHATDVAALTVTNSDPFAITIGGAAKLGFITQPSAATGGTAFGTQPAVAVQDAGGNTVAGAVGAVTLTISQPSNPVGAVLACTSANPLAAAGGVATFAGCRIDLDSATTYTLQATVTTGAAPATSAAFAITTGPAAKLAFTVQPSASTGGTAFSTQPRVTVQDAGGNTVTTGSTGVTLTITRPSSPAAAALTCASANPLATAVGVASFVGCNIDLASVTTYTLHATVTTGPTPATSSPFAISVGAAAQLAFSTQPSASTVNHTAFAQQPVVTVQDAGGNTVTTDNTSSVTLDLTRPSSSVGAVLTCTSATITVTGGVGTFAGCSVDQANIYTLSAADTTEPLESISDAFSIT
jgi:hypothetical protein